MRYTTETIERKVVGPHAGKRIAGASDDMWDVLLTIRYIFDTFTITVTNIPARWDRERDRQYINGTDGLILDDEVMAMAETIMRQRRGKVLGRIPVLAMLEAPDFLPRVA